MGGGSTVLMPELSADQLLAIYSTVLQQMNAGEYSVEESDAAHSHSLLPVAYNLLLTQSFVFVVPRRRQRFEGIEVNSIGFIGSFFVRNAAQRAFFEAQGPMALLREVAFPPSLSSLKASQSVMSDDSSQ